LLPTGEVPAPYAKICATRLGPPVLLVSVLGLQVEVTLNFNRIWIGEEPTTLIIVGSDPRSVLPGVVVVKVILDIVNDLV
jgi:hypothetical protein